MSLSSYLASKYLTAEAPPSKKRKRSKKEPTGLTIQDDDVLIPSGPSANPDEDADGRPLTINSHSAEFRKAKKNNWQTISKEEATDTAAADAIIKQAAAENAKREDDEGPVVEGGDGVVKMGDGTHAGLQSGKDIAKQMEKRRREEKRAWEAEEKLRGKAGNGETIYRDATGKRIDLSMKRAELAREKELVAKKEREEKEAAKGDVQLLEKARRREELEEAKFMTVARGVDDREMNEEMKGVDRWNDPAAQFLTTKKEKRSKSGRKLYMGASAPNRYGIRPGHRWDGVDRGNGWEGERFKALNRVKRNKDLDHAWQMDT